MAIREGIFLGPSHGTLVESTTRGAISYVSQTFRENDQPKPTKYEDGELARVLSRQYRAYKNIDPNPKQKSPSPSVSLLKSSKINQQRPHKARVSWQSEVSSMHADRASIYWSLKQRREGQTF